MGRISEPSELSAIRVVRVMERVIRVLEDEWMPWASTDDNDKSRAGAA